MSIHTPQDNTEWMTENLIQEARNLLEKEDETINKMADTGVGTYYSISLFCLKKQYSSLQEEQIKTLYEACTKKISPSAEKIEAIKKNTPNNIRKILHKDEYSQLADQLSFAYKEFCAQHNMKETDPIPENMRQITVFEYRGNEGKTKIISLSLAHFLLAPSRQSFCREYFISALIGKNR